LKAEPPHRPGDRSAPEEGYDIELAPVGLLVAASDDPRIVKEVHVTTYHILWELVHVFFEQPGVLAPGVVA